MKMPASAWGLGITLLTGILLVATAGKPAERSTPSGVIRGTIRYTGALPPVQTIMTNDGSTIKHRDLLVDAESKGLRYVLVMVEDAPAQAKLKKAEPVVVDQRDWIFQPRVVAVQHGQAVRFDNSDQVNHSVMATSLVAANTFNAIATPGQPVVHTFEPQKQPIMIGCSLHPWMRAWIYVVRHPWFAVTDSRGQFQIERVPPGKYNLLLAHPDSNLRARRTLEVRAGKESDLNFEWTKLQ